MKKTFTRSKNVYENFLRNVYANILYYNTCEMYENTLFMFDYFGSHLESNNIIKRVSLHKVLLSLYRQECTLTSH